MPIDSQPYRPALHFSPRQGWINDPNGLTYADGVHHLFYQHNPAAMVHGPMHWGHATSRDLAHWDEQPIALYPGAEGECFSGSAVAAAEGTVAPELAGKHLLFYTGHQKAAAGKDFQSQCLALADPGLTQFAKYPGNPVIPNNGLEAFRDPKVIWHAPSRRWIMVVTHGQSIGFYSSADAVAWRFESTFGEIEGRHSKGPWECPDLFPLPLEGTGDEHWVLLVGIGTGGIAGGSGTQYFVGDFDGHRFVNSNAPATELWFDEGPDCYATQTWSGPAATRLAISWMSNWQYAAHTPTSSFRGAMTLPRALTLADITRGPRIRQIVPPSLREQFPLLDLASGSATPSGATYRIALAANLRPGEKLSLTLFGETSPQLVVARSGDVTTLRYRRTHPAAGELDSLFDRDFISEGTTTASPMLEVYVDHGLIECSLDHGLTHVSLACFPSDPSGPVHVERTRAG